MSFLQPTLLLLALPVIALPIIIHLINQRRYQTIRWAAMMFLLAANRMSRGYARIRQYLILTARMLAIAGLGFVVVVACMLVSAVPPGDSSNRFLFEVKLLAGSVGGILLGLILYWRGAGAKSGRRP